MFGFGWCANSWLVGGEFGDRGLEVGVVGQGVQARGVEAAVAHQLGDHDDVDAGAQQVGAEARGDAAAGRLLRREDPAGPPDRGGAAAASVIWGVKRSIW
ncbi:hypothetical protein [Microbispora sp. CA-102843]|uniref:hypothetical protein n=1 Tax=Microbispora sp. CA-102843 TaxID=3239952 RepID=UPI003D8A9C29